MIQISEFGKEYLLLGLRMGRVLKDYLDSYFGPPDLATIVETEELYSYRRLLAICRELQQQLPNQGFKPSRHIFLEKMLESMDINLQLKLGVDISFIDQVQKIYDITIKYMPDSQIFKTVERLKNFYKGEGPLIERIAEVYSRRELPREKVIPFMIRSNELVRKKTFKIFPHLLFNGERVEIKEVENVVWGGYNHYLGYYHSRLEVDTTRRHSWASFLEIASHECYPGHHLVSCIQDKLLYQEKGYFEHSIRLNFSPQTVIYEGMACLAHLFLFTDREYQQISLENFCLNPEAENIDDLVVEKRLWKPLINRRSNFAYHLYIDQWSEKRLTGYLKSLEIFPETFIPDVIADLKKSPWETYYFNYYVGEQLIRQKYGDHLSPANFEDLLTHAYIPSNFNM